MRRIGSRFVSRLVSSAARAARSASFPNDEAFDAGRFRRLGCRRLIGSVSNGRFMSPAFSIVFLLATYARIMQWSRAESLPLAQTMSESERTGERFVVGRLADHLGTPAQQIAMSLDVHDRLTRLFDLASQDIHQLLSVGAEFAHHENHIVDGFSCFPEN